MVSSIKWKKLIEGNSAKPDKFFPNEGNIESEPWPPGNLIYDENIRTIIGSDYELGLIQIFRKNIEHLHVNSINDSHQLIGHLVNIEDDEIIVLYKLDFQNGKPTDENKIITYIPWEDIALVKFYEYYPTINKTYRGEFVSSSITQLDESQIEEENISTIDFNYSAIEFFEYTTFVKGQQNEIIIDKSIKKKIKKLQQQQQHKSLISKAFNDLSQEQISNVEKLKGRVSIYRYKRGNLRITFEHIQENEKSIIIIIDIGKRENYY